MSQAQNVLTQAADKLQEQLEKNPNTSVNIYMGKARLPIANNYVILFYHALYTVIDDYDLSRNEIRTMLKILEYMQFGNLISMSQKKLGEDLKINKGRMSTIMKRLKTCGLILDDSGNLYLNPQVIAKGKFLDKQEETLLEKGAEVLQEKLRLGPNILTEKLRKQQEPEQMSLLR